MVQIVKSVRCSRHMNDGRGESQLNAEDDYFMAGNDVRSEARWMNDSIWAELARIA